MTGSWRRILIGSIFFGVTCIVAVTGYMLAGWQFLDAIYMVVITVFGVGYGETRPVEHASLKIFTMGVIIAGCSSGIYVVGGFVQLVAEGEFQRALGNRRMSKGIESLKGHALICGFGRLGRIIAEELAEANFPFVVIDNNETRIAEAQAEGCLAMLGSASEDSVLLAAGLDRARVLATVLPDDTANVFITLTARGLNATIEIIARAESPSTEKKLLRSGANRVVLPALIGATKVANLIVRPSAEDLLNESSGTAHLNEELKQIGLQMSEVVVQPNSSLAETAIGNVEVGGGFVVVAIRKPDGSILRKPSPETSLSGGDTVIVLGHEETAPQLSRRAKARTAIAFRGATS